MDRIRGKKMQHCFYCGEEIGVFEAWPGDYEYCDKLECAREARYQQRADDADARERAEEDHYDRYR